MLLLLCRIMYLYVSLCCGCGYYVIQSNLFGHFFFLNFFFRRGLNWWEGLGTFGHFLKMTPSPITNLHHYHYHYYYHYPPPNKIHSLLQPTFIHSLLPNTTYFLLLTSFSSSFQPSYIFFSPSNTSK